MKDKLILNQGEMYNKHKRNELKFRCFSKIMNGLEFKTVLDIGGYIGILRNYLQQGVKYVLAERDDGAREEAKRQSVKTIKIGDLEHEKIPVESKSYDIVIAADLIEHIHDTDIIISEMKRISKRYIIISLPNECNLHLRMRVLIGNHIDPHTWSPVGHAHHPNIQQAREFVSEHFRILKEIPYINIAILKGKTDNRRISWYGKVFTKIPFKFWFMLANLRPQLFARGMIFLCEKKNYGE